MYLAGRLTAKLLLELCTLITQAGGIGVRDLARELRHGKNAARCVAQRVGIDTIKRECLVYYPIPQHARKGKPTKILPLPIIPFHEALSRSFAKKPEEFLKHVQHPECLAPNFYKHPSVIKYGADRCIPLRLFIDYAKLDQAVSTLNVLQLCCNLSTQVLWSLLVL